MYRGIFLSIVLVVFVLGSTSVALLYFGFDPDQNTQAALMIMGSAIFLSLASFLTLVLYFLKKIISRGQVSSLVLFASLRQGILMTVYVFGLYIFDRAGILTTLTIILLALVLICIGGIVAKIDR